ncbi:hypothetical protein BSL78_03008 [Apostichopus japonicus]|uniref:Uncharacterized protein n=1 Tax=Stichopus japonicus TaxID=307972 RepID=A0A2G8LIL9_STIJA|nr:hypothetical protein BSL78_03008 [Apostichopus japonicus]
MAYNEHVIVVLGLLILFAGIPSNGSPTEKKRQKRHVEGASGASIPDVSAMLQSQSQIQSAYFLGQCLMCPPGPQGPPGQQGVMAGSHYTHAGGAADYLCLSKDPIFNSPTAGFQYNTYLYGVEYETGSSQLYPNLQNFEAPCAVCLAPSKSIALILPGGISVQIIHRAGWTVYSLPMPAGRHWRLEYKGFIMSQHHSHPRTMHVCVDGDAEGISRTHGDHNGALLYIVEATCATGGGLPCPPYTEDMK